MRHRTSARLFRATVIATAVSTCIPALGQGASAGTAGSSGQPAPSTMPTVTVSANRSSALIEDSSRAIDVVEPRRLDEAAGVSGIQRLLAETPGIEFARSGGLGGQISLRGFNSNLTRSVLLLDGDRYRGRSTLEFNMFDPNAIERIEVIRGAASALYGADAMNGIVNVVSRRAKVDPAQPFALSARLRAVDYSSVDNMLGGRAELVGGGNGFDVLVGAHARSADDYRTPLGRALNSNFESRGLDFNVGFRPDALSRIELSGRYQVTTTGRAGGLGAAPGAPWQEVREDPIEERYLRLGYERRQLGPLADRIEATLYNRRFDTDIYQVNRTNPTVTAATHLQVYTPVVWGGHVTAFKSLGNHLLSYGGDFFDEDFVGRVGQTTRLSPATNAVIGSTVPAYMERRSHTTEIGMFINDDWTVSDRLSLAGTLRADRVRTKIGTTPLAGESAVLQQTFAQVGENVTNSAVTGNLGAIWKVTPRLHLTGNVGRGFRAPSGQERTLTGAAGTIVTLPSPDLRSETSTTIEAGVRWRGAGFGTRVTAYRTRYSDLIVLSPLSATLYQRRNVGSAEIEGLEAQGDWQFAPGWRAGFVLTATRGTDLTTGVPLIEIAPLTSRLSLRYDDRGGWYGEGVVRAYKGKSRIDPAQERATAGYGIVDLYAGIDVDRLAGGGWKGWRVIAGVENLLNKAGRNPSVAQNMSFPQGLVGNPLVEPGRSLVVRLAASY